jgi:hypothetical protein
MSDNQRPSQQNQIFERKYSDENEYSDDESSINEKSFNEDPRDENARSNLINKQRVTTTTPVNIKKEIASVPVTTTTTTTPVTAPKNGGYSFVGDKIFSIDQTSGTCVRPIDKNIFQNDAAWKDYLIDLLDVKLSKGGSKTTNKKNKRTNKCKGGKKNKKSNTQKKTNKKG